MSIFPSALLNQDAFYTLADVLKEKNAERRRVRGRQGKRVKHVSEARKILIKIKDAGDAFLHISKDIVEMPSINLKDRLSLLPAKAVKLHALYWSIGTGILLLNSPILEPGPASWVVKSSVVFMYAVPTLISRRVKLNLEHECGYVNVSGRGTIYIHQLPEAQFHSYLAHEYGHHLFSLLAKQDFPQWLKEGWARFFQWQLMKKMYDETGNGAYLVHVLEQVVGELKFACQLLGALLFIKIPWNIRRISTIYNRNPLWRVLTGSPSFNVMRLIDHSVGTACYFWAERKIGIEKMLEDKLFLQLK